MFDRVAFVEFQEGQKLWSLFDDFDTIIISTKTIEAFCLTALEAQAHGLPVIYSDVGGVKDFIGESGVMFRAGDYHNLVEKIKFLMFNFEKLTYYSDFGLKNASSYKISKTRSSL